MTKPKVDTRTYFYVRMECGHSVELREPAPLTGTSVLCERCDHYKKAIRVERMFREKKGKGTK